MIIAVNCFKLFAKEKSYRMRLINSNSRNNNAEYRNSNAILANCDA